MNNLQNFNNCIYNLLYIQYNEDFGIEENFIYDLEHPIFFNVKNSYFKVDQAILNDLNNTVKSDIDTFRDGIYEEMVQYNANAAQNNTPKRTYQISSNYDITFSKNHVISFTVNLISYINNSGPEYNDLYSYNIDLLTGQPIPLSSLFNEGVDYIKLISDYINYTISQTPDMFYKDTVIDIPNSQSFYLTDAGIVIYFGLEEIAPKDIGVPKFLISFEKFGSYINPRFYCVPQNIQRKFTRNRRR